MSSRRSGDDSRQIARSLRDLIQSGVMPVGTTLPRSGPRGSARHEPQHRRGGVRTARRRRAGRSTPTGRHGRQRAAGAERRRVGGRRCTREPGPRQPRRRVPSRHRSTARPRLPTHALRGTCRQRRLRSTRPTHAQPRRPRRPSGPRRRRCRRRTRTAAHDPPHTRRHRRRGRPVLPVQHRSPQRPRSATRPVAVDSHGLLPDPLDEALRSGARAVIITPRAHNPTGASIDSARARSSIPCCSTTRTCSSSRTTTSRRCLPSPTCAQRPSPPADGRSFDPSRSSSDPTYE